MLGRDGTAPCHWVPIGSEEAGGGQAREPGERGWVWISGGLESDSDLPSFLLFPGLSCCLKHGAQLPPKSSSQKPMVVMMWVLRPLLASSVQCLQLPLETRVWAGKGMEAGARGEPKSSGGQRETPSQRTPAGRPLAWVKGPGLFLSLTCSKTGPWPPVSSLILTVGLMLPSRATASFVLGGQCVCDMPFVSDSEPI